MKFRGLCGALALLLAGVQPATAQGFDPHEACGTLLSRATPSDRIMIAAWTFGFVAAATDEAHRVDAQNNAGLLGNITKACQSKPTVSLFEIVNRSKEPPTPQPGSAAEARAMLLDFYKPGADHRALTQALKPSEEDIRAVYDEPLATTLVGMYKSLFTPNIAFKPKPEHNDIYLYLTTTRQLVEDPAVQREFAGGYKKVLQYFRSDVPIARFKFITKGEKLGLSFNGLMYVNGRWVIMPKPYRALEN